MSNCQSILSNVMSNVIIYNVLLHDHENDYNIKKYVLIILFYFLLWPRT